MLGAEKMETGKVVEDRSAESRGGSCHQDLGVSGSREGTGRRGPGLWPQAPEGLGGVVAGPAVLDRSWAENEEGGQAGLPAEQQGRQERLSHQRGAQGRLPGEGGRWECSGKVGTNPVAGGTCSVPCAFYWKSSSGFLTGSGLP